jgi:uncharacterized membrane protein
MEKLLLKRKKIIKNIELNRKLIIFTCAIFICDATKIWQWVVLFVLFALNSTKTTKLVEEAKKKKEKEKKLEEQSTKDKSEKEKQQQEKKVGELIENPEN